MNFRIISGKLFLQKLWTEEGSFNVFSQLKLALQKCLSLDFLYKTKI